MPIRFKAFKKAELEAANLENREKGKKEFRSILSASTGLQQVAEDNNCPRKAKSVGVEELNN